MKVLNNMNLKLSNAKNSIKNRRFRKGDGVFLLVIGAAIGTLILIGFYLLAKEGLGSWGQAFKTLVSM